MSQPNTDPSIQNGLPYKWDGTKNPNFTPYALNNGVGSSQSSRDSSPVPKLSNVPLSQLPPSRSQIPSSQLPPGRPSVSPVVGPHGVSYKSAHILTSTPSNSPLTLNTSTPIMKKTEVNSAGNISTGSNSFVNVSLSSSVPPTLPNPIDSSVRVSRVSPVQMNSSLTNSNTKLTHMRQNLNHPATTQQSDLSRSSIVQQTHDRYAHPSGNLLTNQQDQSMPAFMPVSGQTVFPVPPSSTKTSHPFENQSDQNKPPSSTQTHFSNPPSKFGPSQTHSMPNAPNHMQKQQNVPSGSPHQPASDFSHNVIQNQSNSSPISFPQQQERLPPFSQQQIISQSGVQEVRNQKQLPQSTTNLFDQQSSDFSLHPAKSLNQLKSMQDKPEINAAVANQNVRLSTQQAPIPAGQQTPTNQQMHTQPMISSSHDLPKKTFPNQTNANPLLMGANTQNLAQLNSQMTSTPVPQSVAVTNSPSQYFSTQNSQQYKNAPPPSQPINNQQPIFPFNPSLGPNRPPLNQSYNLRPAGSQSMGASTQFRPLMPNQNSENQQMGSLSNHNLGNKQPAPPLISQNVDNQRTNSPFHQNMGNQIFPPPLTNQNVGTLPKSAVITGKPYPQPPSSQSASPFVNQNITSTTNQQIGPPGFYSKILNPIGNIPPQPLGPPVSNQNVEMQSQQGHQNTMGVPPTSRPSANQFTGPSPMNQNKYDPSDDINRPSIYKPPSESPGSENVTSANQYPTTPTSSYHGRRYPQTNYQSQPPVLNAYSQNRQNVPNQMYQQSYGQNYQSLNQGMQNMNLGPSGLNRIYGAENMDLLQTPNVLPQEKMEPPKVCLGQECLNAANCSSE